MRTIIVRVSANPSQKRPQKAHSHITLALSDTRNQTHPDETDLHHNAVFMMLLRLQNIAECIPKTQLSLTAQADYGADGRSALTCALASFQLTMSPNCFAALGLRKLRLSGGIVKPSAMLSCIVAKSAGVFISR
jgi:hypothetical protein